MREMVPAPANGATKKVGQRRERKAKSGSDTHLLKPDPKPDQHTIHYSRFDTESSPTKVKSLLAEDDFLKSFQISVETYQGTVQLSGFVNSQQAVDKAGEIVRSVKGVKSIKNNLIVK